MGCFRFAEVNDFLLIEDEYINLSDEVYMKDYKEQLF